MNDFDWLFISNIIEFILYISFYLMLFTIVGLVIISFLPKNYYDL